MVINGCLGKVFYTYSATLIKCSSKLKLESRITPRCFSDVVSFTVLLLKVRGMIYFLGVSTRNIFFSFLIAI